MSKRSRQKHSRLEFEAVDSDTDPDDTNDALCNECGYYPKKANRDVCEACDDIEYTGRV
jgi:hypothetical protein